MAHWLPHPLVGGHIGPGPSFSTSILSTRRPVDGAICVLLALPYTTKAAANIRTAWILLLIFVFSQDVDLICAFPYPSRKLPGFSSKPLDR